MDANVEGISDYKRGQWSVVLRRNLSTSKEEDASFAPGETTPMILAIWNGEKKEVNGRKSVTYGWIPARFDGIGSTTAKVDVGASSANE
jgi:DMSO reductase family type II enzyme heme b subunit